MSNDELQHEEIHENNVKFKSVYEGEYMIQNLISNDNNCSAHFEYNYGRYVILKLLTYNPNHKSHFLLHSIEGDNNIDCLEKMYDHIFTLKTTLKKKDNPYVIYSIDWFCPDTKKIVTSSFYGDTIEQVLMKFNYGKQKKLVIYNMKLVPNC